MRNGVNFVPRENEMLLFTNSTVTGLQINVTKGVHETGTYYKCFIANKTNASDQKHSNGVTFNIVGRFYIREYGSTL